MHHASSRGVRSWLSLGVLAMSLTSMGAMAATGLPSTGLGQSWPNATDVSASSHWHVYLFQRDGVRYVQINDLNGTVRAAVGTAGGTFLTLPLGSDAAQVATPSEPLAVTGSTAGDIVYQDSTVKVLVAPQADGTTRTYVAAGNCTDPVECSSRFGISAAPQALTAAGKCTDPVECSSRFGSTATSAAPQTLTAAGKCTDPVECSSRFNSTAAPQVITAAGKCTDPVECSSRDPINAASAPVAPTSITTLGKCTDPVECSSRNQ